MRRLNELTLYLASWKTGTCKIDFCIDYEQIKTHFEIELATKIPNAETWIYKKYKRKTLKAAHEIFESLVKQYEIK